jgi:hypothetical protein
MPVLLSCALLAPLGALAEETAATPAAKSAEQTTDAESAKPEKPKTKAKAKVYCAAPTGSILSSRKKDCKTDSNSKTYSAEDLRKSRDFDASSKATAMGR